MPKFNKTLDELETRFDKWLYVIRNLSRLDRVPDRLRERVFEKLFEVAEISRFTREQILSYEDSLKYYRDLKNSLDTARDEGRDEGREEERKDIAQKLLALGTPVAIIVTATGLTEAQIESLQ
jgi:predicted transposase/invertase (TIGR01784 family)